MSRTMLIVPEKQERIETIKKKYKEAELSDKTADKVYHLEAVNKVLTAATGVVGIIAALDWIIPDPVLGLDEVALTGLTALLGSGSAICQNKINDLVASGNAQLQMEEVNTLTSQLQNVLQSIGKGKAKAK